MKLTSFIENLMQVFPKLWFSSLALWSNICEVHSALGFRIVKGAADSHKIPSVDDTHCSFKLKA